MADRASSSGPNNQKGELVLGSRISSVPLLPFEHQLIDLLGITKEEYVHFSQQAALSGKVRPAEYDIIPDIRNEPVSTTLAIISLAVGVASTAAAYFLRPKPAAVRDPGSQSQVGQRKLSDITGTDRFTPTYGFDSATELANYGDPIPIVFGKYESQYNTGGILVTPRLVWSRMFSYGGQQAIKMLFVIGEQGRDARQIPQGLDAPNLPGIFIGNGALDSLDPSQYAFYWKRNTTISGFARVKAINLLYGTRGTLSSGDPEDFDDVFSCPTRNSEKDTGFSSAHSLSNNSEFGCYAPIPNGTDYRVNWRIVAKPEIEGRNDDPQNRIRMERTKIAGLFGYQNEPGFSDPSENVNNEDFFRIGQAGTGRGYSRRMGLTHLNGSSVPNSVGRETRYVNVGDTAIFTIARNQIPTNFYQYGDAGVRVDDINGFLNQERIAADNAMQAGETFMIARTVWQVTKRKLAIWRPEDDQDQTIELKCLEILGERASSQIGLIADEMLRADYLSDDVGAVNNLHAGAPWYPLMRYSLGLVRNTRACDVTEIGLKSRVFQRLNGLCNFQSLPTPNQLIESEENSISITSGVISQYIQRSSFFTIQIRPAGLDESFNEYPFHVLGEQFVVVGNAPVDQYNFIRLKHPERRQYEFRFVPKNGADMRISPTTAKFILLNAGGSTENANEREVYSRGFDTPYGRFQLYAVGKEVPKIPLQYNQEFMASPNISGASSNKTYPDSIGVYAYLPDDTDNREKMTDCAITDRYGVPNFTAGRFGAFFEEVFGVADFSYDGEQTKEVYYDASWGITGGRWFKERWRYERERLPANHWSGRTYTWKINGRSVIDSSFGWNILSDFVISRLVSTGNSFRNVPGQGTLIYAGERRRVTGTSISEYPVGRAQGWMEEMFGPARNYGFGEYRTRSLTGRSGGGKQIQFTARARVIYVPNHWSGTDKHWGDLTYDIVRSTPSTSSNWLPGDKFDITFTVSGGNPFRQPGTTVGARFSVESVQVSFDQNPDFTADRIFEFQSQYADISFYGDLVEKSNKGQPEHTISYVNEMLANENIPNYDRLSIVGLALKAGRNFTSINQLRMWLPRGVPVTNLHPDDGGAVQPSNLFTDLVYYLLTNATAGVGISVGMTADNAPLIDRAGFEEASKFLRSNRLFYDGVLGTRVNLRSFIADTAPYMLLDFVLKDGQFSLRPAVPTTSSGELLTGPVEIRQIFTSGNIIEDSFSLTYLSAEERKPFQAVVRYREEQPNQLPKELTLSVRRKEDSEFSGLESFDLTQYCTSREHASLVARFFLSVRKRITHSISFKTTPSALGLSPGDYIRVVTEASPYSPVKNGVVDSSGNITSAYAFVDGLYSVKYYRQGSTDIFDGVMFIRDNRAQDSSFYNTLFTVYEETTSESVYMVEQLTVDEEGLVSITASEYPCDSGYRSIIVQDLLDDGLYIEEG